MQKISRKEAIRVGLNYQLEPTPLPQLFNRLGTIQYDPLNPLGRNPDLTLQARVKNYKIDDWQKLAYTDRHIYDAWDKQACLVLLSDWPYRRVLHNWGRSWWENKIFADYPKEVKATKAALKEHGPMSSLDFEDQSTEKNWRGSWYGPKLVKNILKALWDAGEVVTDHRIKGRHVYGLAEDVIPKDLYNVPEIDAEECLKWLILRRHQTAGILRENVNNDLWFLPIKSAERKRIMAELVEEEKLVALDIEGIKFHTQPNVLKAKKARNTPKMHFLAPLDPIMWDRDALEHLHNFYYRWEVYKPEAKREWGYYVLPVLFENQFVARFDSRLVKDAKGKSSIWEIYAWYWESKPTEAMLSALSDAATRFMNYLGADAMKLPKKLDKATKDALKV